MSDIYGTITDAYGFVQRRFARPALSLQDPVEHVVDEPSVDGEVAEQPAVHQRPEQQVDHHVDVDIGAQLAPRDSASEHLAHRRLAARDVTVERLPDNGVVA